MDMTSMLFYLAPIIGLGALTIGILAMLWPQKMSEKFGISVVGESLPYVISTGVRDVFIGLVVILLYKAQNWSVLGYVHFFIAVVAVSDFAVVIKHGVRKTALVHAFGAVLVSVYGFFLISR